MAQRVHPISFRLGINHFWDSEWYSNTNYASLFFEDNLIKHYFKNIFEKRGFFFKRALIKRSATHTFIFLEIYGNPYFKHVVPRRLRQFKVFQRVLQLPKIRDFLTKLSSSQSKIHLSVQNLFMMNRIHRNYLRRLRNHFYRYKRYRFTLTILGIFNIVIRTKAASFLTRILATELGFIERKKKNKDVWRFVSFVGKLVSSYSLWESSLHGLRIQLKGRFRGISRPKTVRFRAGAVPFNTIRALIDYSYVPVSCQNGTFSVKAWLTYRAYQG